MTKGEFEELVGLEVDDLYFANVVEPQYMATDEDADGFCESWRRRHSGMTQRLMEEVESDTLPLLEDLRDAREKAFANAESADRWLHAKQEAEKKAASAAREELEALHERVYALSAEAPYDTTLRDLSVECLGWRGYLRRRLRDGATLSDDETDKLVGILGKEEE